MTEQNDWTLTREHYLYLRDVLLCIHSNLCNSRHELQGHLQVWKVEFREDKWLVVGVQNGKVYGEHPTEEKAEAHIGALELNVTGDQRPRSLRPEILNRLQLLVEALIPPSYDRRTWWSERRTRADPPALELETMEHTAAALYAVCKEGGVGQEVERLAGLLLGQIRRLQA